MAKAKNLMDGFFKLGDKATGGDPVRMADFNYYLLWLMFLSFFSIFLTSIFTAISYFGENTYMVLRNFAWSGVMFAIMWFQYQALRSQRDSRNNLKEVYKNIRSNSSENGEKIENIELPNDSDDSIESMMKEFPDDN